MRKKKLEFEEMFAKAYPIIRPYTEQIGKDPRKIYKDHLRCQKRYGASWTDYRTYHYDQYPKRLRKYCMTEAFITNIVRTYNDAERSMLFKDKAEFNRIFQPYLGRQWLDCQSLDLPSLTRFLQGKEKIVLKPKRQASGRGVEILRVAERTAEQWLAYLAPQTDFLLEEFLYQHPAMARLYPPSVNTVRVLTLNHKHQCHIIVCVLRAGIDHEVDNFDVNGVLANIHEQTGVVDTPSINHEGQRFAVHPVTQVPFVGFQVPFWPQTLELVRQVYDKVDGVGYIGWDIAYLENGPILVEGNAPFPGYFGMDAPFLGQKMPFKRKLERILRS